MEELKDFPDCAIARSIVVPWRLTIHRLYCPICRAWLDRSKGRTGIVRNGEDVICGEVGVSLKEELTKTR